ncbi:MAG TPA: PilT/PilU family type 4a pilus ATPase [Planctomycetota bacterium]
MNTPTILLVDPNPESAGRNRDVLAADGAAVEVVYTGEACLGAVSKAPPALVVLDLALPDRAGFDVLRKLHKHFPGLPVVVMSDAVAPQDVVAALKAGAADLVAKPVDPRRMSMAARQALQDFVAKEELERLTVETGGPIKVDDILSELVAAGGSDLHLKVGRPPLFRISGDLTPSALPELSEKDMESLLLQVLGRPGYRTLEEQFESDSSYLLPGIARFRVNAFKRMGQFGAAFRLIPLTVPTIEMMKLPPVLKEITKAPQGLVLVTGPTGSGKSTTLAAMMDYLNETQPLHVVTLEDPVEFVYTDKKCAINQRQLGNDVKSFHEALRRVLRQDPDVILMGEMRDRESMELAMHAAETGHLVFSTLHTNDAKQTLDRIIDAFPTDAHHQVRSQLALTLQAVIGQRLVRRADGRGRVAAVEVMIASPAIRELIHDGKTSSIEKAIAASGDYYGMQTFNQALAKHVNAGTITAEEAMASSTTPGDLRLLLKGVQSGSTAVISAPQMKEAFQAAKTPLPVEAGGKMKISRGF